MPDSPSSKEKTSLVRWVCFTVILLALIGAGVYLAKRAIDIPTRDLPDAVAKTIDSGSRGLERLANAISHQEILTQYHSTAAAMAGTRRLQVASLEQTEHFRRRETWQFGDAEVTAAVPTEFTYFVDLADDWIFLLDGNHLQVGAPELKPNTPAPDISKTTFDVIDDSILLDEEKITETLRQSITPEMKVRATENADLVRELARKQVESFVRQWLAGEFGEMSDLRLSITFLGEPDYPEKRSPIPPAPVPETESEATPAA